MIKVIFTKNKNLFDLKQTRQHLIKYYGDLKNIYIPKGTTWEVLLAQKKSQDLQLLFITNMKRTLKWSRT